jgi:hypothetical protein
VGCEKGAQVHISSQHIEEVVKWGDGKIVQNRFSLSVLVSRYSDQIMQDGLRVLCNMYARDKKCIQNFSPKAFET